MASTPHDAGTPGDLAVIDALGAWFESFGLTVEKQELWLYLPEPISARVQVLPGDGGDPIELNLREIPAGNDPYAGNPDARPGWNAWAGTGDVTAPVVYANYGRLEDFQKLEALGVDLTGKVVIARYGGNFRGYKAKYAEQAGAAALLIYTDPADSGWGRGIPWPEGGFANGSSIQRGSLLTLDYPGDALTPFDAATKDAERLDPDSLALPTIPVEPIGWDAARVVLSRMTGPSVPDGWQGGLPFRYRLSGGDELRVRVSVEQERKLVRTFNVIGTIEGAVEPERTVIVGCHHDAWGFGAGDPTSGLIALLESARSVGEAAAAGAPPRRTIKFAAWAAEEHGIIGSVEYAEAYSRELSAGAVAYINLDMAAMGPDFSSAASPSLRRVVADAAGQVPQARDPGTTVREAWLARGEDPAMPGVPRFGELGGGSDHVSFLCYLCIPSVSLHAGGSEGVSYHSNYDNLAWYRAVVGDDYEPALMIARMTNAVVARLANAKVVPLDPDAYLPPMASALDKASFRAGFDPSVAAAVPAWFGRGGAVGDDAAERASRALMAIERGWCSLGADDGRPWYRNAYIAPDATSGYAPWVLPGVQRGLFIDDVSWAMREAEIVSSWGASIADRAAAVSRMFRSEPDAPIERAPDPRQVRPAGE